MITVNIISSMDWDMAANGTVLFFFCHLRILFMGQGLTGPSPRTINYNPKKQIYIYANIHYGPRKPNTQRSKPYTSKHTCSNLNSKANTCHHHPSPFPRRRRNGVTPDSHRTTTWTFHGWAFPWENFQSSIVDFSSQTPSRQSRS